MAAQGFVIEVDMFCELVVLCRKNQNRKVVVNVKPSENLSKRSYQSTPIDVLFVSLKLIALSLRPLPFSLAHLLPHPFFSPSCGLFQSSCQVLWTSTRLSVPAVVCVCVKLSQAPV